MPQNLGRRGHLEVLMTILDALSSGENHQTRLMYKVNTSYNILDRDLMELEKEGLISCVWERGYYDVTRKEISLTQRGFEVLRAYKKLMKQLGLAENVVWMGTVD